MSENDKRVTFKDVLSRPNKFSSVEIANAAIFDSFNNKNQLDFDVLRSKLNEIAQKSATYDPHYSEAAKGGYASDIVALHSRNFNMAARRVLGVVPDNSLEHKYKSLLEKLGVEKQEKLPFTCTVPKNVDFTNLDNGLGANGVKCNKDNSAER